VIERAQLAKICGEGNISDEPGVLEEYSRDMSFVNRVRPGCVLKPGSAEEVKRIVKLARETGTPLVPVSSGGPHFRGDSVPSTGGAVVVDLGAMKRIIRVDRKNRVAMFEPGVTFGELIEATAREGLRLNMPLAPRKTKSVVGSLLEREPVIMPKYQWDMADPLACTEVIFGTGDMFRTGSAAGSGTIEEQWQAGGAQKEAAGPSAASWYRLIQGSQGTMGIVTWASARCELLPRLEEPFFVGAAAPAVLLKAVHWLIRLRLVNECLIVNGADLAAVTGKAADLPPWLLFFNIAAYDYFPEERMKGQIDDVMGVMQRSGLQPAKVIGGVKASGFLEAARNPSGENYWKLHSKGGCEDIFFLSTFDKVDEMIGTVRRVADAAGYPAAEIGVYLQPLVQGTTCHCEFNLFYDPDDPRQAARVRELSKTTTGELLARGAFFSRPYGENARMIMNRDAASVWALKKVKAILDPDGIMNPGKLCF
jgi:FAD/FMN-containing dehydrogenase